MLEVLAALGGISPWALFAGFFGLLLVAAETGYRIGLRHFNRRTEEEPARSGIGFIVGGMLGLLAFLIGISLSIAEKRYEDRRDVVLAEANAISTAWLRAGLVGGAEGAEIQRLLAGYVPVRIEAVRDVRSADEIAANNARAAEMQGQMWSLASTVAREKPTPVSGLLLASLNEVFDLSTTMRRAFASGVPPTVSRLLLWTSLIAVGAMGYSFGATGTRQTVMTLLLLALWSGTVMLISDINRPRHGWVSVSPAPLEWVAQDMAAAPPSR